jgi:hypothetical protein
MNSLDLVPVSASAQTNPARGLAAQAASPASAKLTSTLFSIAAVGTLGIALALWLDARWIGSPEPSRWYDAFDVLFAKNEPAGLAVVLMFGLAAIIWIKRGAQTISLPQLKRPRLTVGLIAIATLTICSLGQHFVCHGYALSADENMADFQAQLFLHGKLTQEVPAFWGPMVRLIIPIHASYYPATHSWASGYLPVYGAIQALFRAAHLQWITNAVLAAISVLTLAALTRRLWPNQSDKTILATALLVASPQFLIMAMSSYAMPAHLALNLVWLWLYCDPEKRRFWLTPVVGVAALGLHQPFFHALFAVPFLFRLLLDRRWKAVVWFASIYLAGVAGCFLWWHRFLSGFPSGGEAKLFGLDSMTALNQAIYFSFLLGWLALPIPLLVSLGVRRIRQQSAFLQDALLSCALTFGFYILVKANQVHGWGDRYFHGVIGCLILVAIAGWDCLCRWTNRPVASTFVAAGVAASMLVQFPLRCFQVEKFVRPFARANEAFHKTDADLLVFDSRLAFYSADLRRNDPFLRQRPIILTSWTIRPSEVEALARMFPRTRFVGKDELKAFGLATALK